MNFDNDEKQDIESELGLELEEVKIWLTQRNLTRKQLIHLCAANIVSAGEYAASEKELLEIIDTYEVQINFSLAALDHGNLAANELIDYFSDWPTKQAELIRRVSEITKKNQHKKAAKHAADCRHSRPGGSRDKHEKIRDIWASGKYADRNTCAEEEYAELDFGAFKTAREALKNTPDPNPWPARKKPRK